MMDRPKISATVITYNEEANIRACLESIRWVDEIIVVDSYSTDLTAEICREYATKVIQREWSGHIKQKQYALEQATGDWILSLDADERLSAEAVAEIEKKIVQDHLPADGYLLPRHSFYLGRWINHSGWYPDSKLRIVRRGCARWGGRDPHDKMILTGKAAALKGEIHHYVYKDISHQLNTVDSFARITAERWQLEGKRFNLLQMLLRPPLRFLAMYLWKLGFLDGYPGFIIAVISSYYVFLRYAKLWELQSLAGCPPEKLRSGSILAKIS